MTWAEVCVHLPGVFGECDVVSFLMFMEPNSHAACGVKLADQQQPPASYIPLNSMKFLFSFCNSVSVKHSPMWPSGASFFSA